MKAISLKTQSRLAQDIKRSICKRCDSLLKSPLSASYRLENLSRLQRKRWADVMVVECHRCGLEKRIPNQPQRCRGVRKTRAKDQLEAPRVIYKSDAEQAPVQ